MTASRQRRAPGGSSARAIAERGLERRGGEVGELARRRSAAPGSGAARSRAGEREQPAPVGDPQRVERRRPGQPRDRSAPSGSAPTAEQRGADARPGRVGASPASAVQSPGCRREVVAERGAAPSTASSRSRAGPPSRSSARSRRRPAVGASGSSSRTQCRAAPGRGRRRRRSAVDEPVAERRRAGRPGRQRRSASSRAARVGSAKPSARAEPRRRDAPRPRSRRDRRHRLTPPSRVRGPRGDDRANRRGVRRGQTAPVSACSASALRGRRPSARAAAGDMPAASSRDPGREVSAVTSGWHCTPQAAPQPEGLVRVGVASRAARARRAAR